MQPYIDSLANAEKLAFGYLKLNEQEFYNVELTRLRRVSEYLFDVEEQQLAQTRILCYWMGNHKAKSVEDLWLLPSELAKRQRDIIEGKVPFATFRTLTKEELENWTKN